MIKWQSARGRNFWNNLILTVTKPAVFKVTDLAPKPIKTYKGLSSERIKESLGSEDNEKSNINIVDIHEDEILPEKVIWMTKSLTDPKLVPKYAIENPANDTFGTTGKGKWIRIGK